jgi:hypothetical protein
MIAALIHDGTFSEDVTRAMGAAFDLACKSLPHPCHNDAVREIIARHIIEAAKTGEQDPAKLSEKALRVVGTDDMSVPLVGVGRDPPTRTYA